MKYINKVKIEDLIGFLNRNGILVVDDLDDIKEEFIQPNVDTYYLRCELTKESDEFSILSKYVSRNKLMSTIFTMSPQYCLNNREIYAIDDFMIRRAFTLDQQEVTKEDIELQRNYHTFMCGQFENSEYISDYNRFVESLNAEDSQNY